MQGKFAILAIVGFLGSLLLSGCAKNVQVATPGVITEPVIGMFIADPPEVALGGSTTLRWVVCCTGDGGTVTITPEIGVVSLTGNTVVKPTGPVTYTLTASGVGGNTVARVSIRLKQMEETAGRWREPPR